MKSAPIFIVILLFLVSLSIHSQIELKGKIVDFTNLLPIENASVYIKNTTIGTVSNTDGKFVLTVSERFANDTLVISSIGFKSYKSAVKDFDVSQDIFLEEDIASLDEVVLIAEPRPTTGNDIVLKAIEKLERNLPDSSYLQKGFLRHKERNSKEFKWLIESAITVYDSGYAAKSEDYLKVNVDEVRKSYDLRDVDSLFTYVSYRNQNSKSSRLSLKDINRDDVSKEQLIKAIKWNDNRINGLQNIFQGKLNLLRNSKDNNSLFGESVLKTHQFQLDTILVDDGRKVYKIRIDESSDYIDLETKGIYNDGYKANGWLYIYYDNYAVKRVEYELVAASEVQKERSKRLLGTQINHKLIINYMDYYGKMYPNYIYYETPKLVNVALKSKGKITEADRERFNKEERYYTTIQEILFSEIILDSASIQMVIQGGWDIDIFSPKPYNKSFWKNYNILLESDEDEQLIEDLSKRATLFKD